MSKQYDAITKAFLKMRFAQDGNHYCSMCVYCEGMAEKYLEEVNLEDEKLFEVEFDEVTRKTVKVSAKTEEEACQKVANRQHDDSSTYYHMHGYRIENLHAEEAE